MDPENYIVVCEGPSERAYLQRLNEFLEKKLPVNDNYLPRLKLIPKIVNDGEGGGQFSLVRKSFRKCQREQRETKIQVWIDIDIYIRNPAEEKAYAKKEGVPDFLFSVMNFEDFLALHFDEVYFKNWCESIAKAGHLSSPLTSEKHALIFEPIWNDQTNKWQISNAAYKKGNMPVDFVSKERLCNMIRHVQDPQIVKFFSGTRKFSQRTFAEFLSECLQRLYPEELK